MSVAAVNLGRPPQRPLGTFLSESSPRNHFYRTGHPFTEDGPFLVLPSQADLDHLRNLADDLYFEAVLHGSDDDTLKETAQHLNSLIPDFRVLESLL